MRYGPSLSGTGLQCVSLNPKGKKAPSRLKGLYVPQGHVVKKKQLLTDDSTGYTEALPTTFRSKSLGNSLPPLTCLLHNTTNNGALRSVMACFKVPKSLPPPMLSTGSVLTYSRLPLLLSNSASLPCAHENSLQLLIKMRPAPTCGKLPDIC